MIYISRFISFISRVAPKSFAALALVALLGGGLITPTSVQAAGKVFYVSSSDTTASDTNTGLSSTTAWKSIARVNTALTAGTITAGDTVYFKRGDTFYGGLVMARSGSTGSPIVFTSTTSYSGGSGAKPVISGFTPISSGWTSVGTNLWEIAAPAGVNNLSTMVMNGVVVPLGRFPKETAANGGYLAMSYTAATGANITFTDSTGTLASQPNFAGADVVFRPNHWTQARGTVLTHAGNVVTLTQKASSYSMANGIGFFIQNNPNILTQNGEWAYIAGAPAKIRLYYAGTPPTVSFSSVDKLVSLSTYDYFTFSNLSFEGAKSNAFDGNTAGFVGIDSNDIKYAGQHAIYLNYGNDITINNNTITDSQNNGILVNSPTLNNVTVTNNTITNTGVRMGTTVPLSTSDTLNGINVKVASNALIQGNTVRFTGDNGIRFNGSNVTIRNNIVSDFTLQLDDGGGIYTYGGGNTPANPAVTQYTNRVIDQNIVYNGNGAPYGTASNGRQSSGIYLDNNSNHIDITNNTIFDVVTKGIPLNSPQNVKIIGNTIFNTNKGGIGICRWMNDGTQSNGGQDPIGLTVTGNTLFNISDGQVVLSYCDFGIKEANPTNLTVLGTVKLNSPASTIDSRLRSMSTVATFNNNTYRTLEQPSINMEYQETTDGPYLSYPDYSLDLWKKHTGFDAGSVNVPVKKYNINSTGATLFNSALDALTGITTSGTTSTLTLDTTSKVTGVGSGKITVVTPPTSSNFNYKAYSVFVGLNAPISSTKKYLVKFNTVGTTENGMMKVSMYKKVAPYAYLSTSQYSAYGTNKVAHEFLFANPTGSGTSNGSVLIEMLEASGDTYIDDIQVYEVDATVLDPNADVIFEYNTGAFPRTVALPAGNYYKPNDVTYTSAYSGTVTIPAYSSIILVKPVGAVVVPDTIIPTISITSPSASSTLSGPITISASATDAGGVAKVDFYQGTTLIGTDTTAPYTAIWDTTTVSNGSYTLKAVATDTSNNSATSASIAVTVGNTVADTIAPTVSVTTPIVGAALSGATTLTANASDNVGVVGVDFYQGTTLIGTDTTVPYTAIWDTTAAINGPYVLRAVARDAAGNSTSSATIAVVVTNTTVDTTAPIVTMSSPAAGSVLSGPVTLTADASDNVGITKVNLYVGSTLMSSDTTAPYTASWNTTLSSNGTFGLKAIAYDAAGNMTTSPSVVVSVNNVVVPPISVAISTPTTGSTVSGTVALTATTTGTGITSVDFYKDSDTSPFASTSSSYTTFFDTKTITNGTHTFKAVAKTSTTSVTSAVITVTIYNTTVTTPGAPTTVAAVPGYTKAKVQWGAPLTNGGAAITSYKVTSTPGNFTASATVSPAIVTGLTNGTSYTFAVQAINSVGAGAAATTSSIKPVANFTVGSQVIVSTTSSSLTVRKTASTNGTKVGTVTSGTIGTVTQTGTGWTKVQFPTMLGWVSSTYLFSN